MSETGVQVRIPPASPVTTQGLSDVEEAGPESIEELLEEGNSFEAEAISGIENAPDADVSGVHTKQVPEDDVPLEYQQEDRDDS